MHAKTDSTACRGATRLVVRYYAQGRVAPVYNYRDGGMLHVCNAVFGAKGPGTDDVTRAGSYHAKYGVHDTDQRGTSTQTALRRLRVQPFRASGMMMLG